MKPNDKLTHPRKTFATVALVTLGLTIASARAQSAITWSVKNIVDGKTDVSTKGKLCIAVNLGPEVCEKVVNGVHFQADRAHWTKKILVRGQPRVNGQMYWPPFNSGGFVLKGKTNSAATLYNRAAPNIGPRTPNDLAYDEILRHGRHNNGGTKVVTCTLEGLTPGNTYEIQIFYGNKGRPTRITEWDNGMGGREGKGGIFLRPVGPAFGQVATGTFKATASGKQTFSNYQQPANANTNPPLKQTFNACSAIQVRDLTPKPLAARATYYGEGTPGTNTQPNLGGSRCSPAINLTGHPVMNSTVKLTAENSSDLATSAMLVIGLAPATIPFLSGQLLVTPAVTLPVAMPRPVSPYVHTHELQITLKVPAAPIPVYAQVLQLDKGAKEGVSFTPGMKIEIGF